MDNSRSQLKRLPACPPIHCLGALEKCSSRNLQFPQRVPFTKKTMPWCHCPFKKRSIQACQISTSTLTRLFYKNCIAKPWQWEMAVNCGSMAWTKTASQFGHTCYTLYLFLWKKDWRPIINNPHTRGELTIIALLPSPSCVRKQSIAQCMLYPCSLVPSPGNLGSRRA